MEKELGRSKISSRYQIVLPEGVRKHFKLPRLEKGKELYAYFYAESAQVKIKIAAIERKEEVKFI